MPVDRLGFTSERERQRVAQHLAIASVALSLIADEEGGRDVLLDRAYVDACHAIDRLVQKYGRIMPVIQGGANGSSR